MKKAARKTRNESAGDQLEAFQPFPVAPDTSMTPKGADAASGTCVHCGGAGTCSCRACTLGRTPHSAPCCMCQGESREAWLGATKPQEDWHSVESMKEGLYA
jgi:hypothetical protein